MKPIVRTLYDPGTAKPLEDKLVVASPFFGVLDGFNELFSPDTGPKLYDGRSAGMIAVDIVEKIFKNAQAEESLEQLLLRANGKMKDFFESKGLDMEKPETLGGTFFAISKIGEREIEIIQGGDSFAMWVGKDNAANITPNQVYHSDREGLAVLNALIEKNQGDRDQAWREYIPVSARIKRQRVNNPERGYTALNGQEAAANCWVKKNLPRKDVKLILLFTDGMAQFDETGQEKILAERILSAYQSGGLQALLKRIRGLEQTGKEKRHIDHVEATAVSLEF